MEVNGRTLIELVEKVGKHTEAVQNLAANIKDFKEYVNKEFGKLPCIHHGEKIKKICEWKQGIETEKNIVISQKVWSYKKVVLFIMIISIASSVFTTICEKVF